MKKIGVLPVVVTMILTILTAAVIIGACTEQMQARSWGGEADMDIPCGQKLVMVTWKEDNIWTLTRPWQDGDIVQEYTFTESSSWGALEGTVHLKECIKKH